jgi:class 3 adenylate cyclase
MRETRKLVVIMDADVVAYSPLTGTGEDQTLVRLRGPRGDLVDPTIAGAARVPER